MTTPDEERAYWGERATLDGVWSSPEWTEGEQATRELVEGWIVPWILDGGTVLDLGCGIGRVAIHIARAYPSTMVLGVDVSPRMLTIAFNRAQVLGLANMGLAQCDGRHLPPVRRQLDAAWSMLMFQHVAADTASGYVRQLAGALKVGGGLLVQYVPGAPGGPFDQRHPEGAVEGWCEEAGLTIINVEQGGIHPDWRWVDALRA